MLRVSPTYSKIAIQSPSSDEMVQEFDPIGIGFKPGTGTKVSRSYLTRELPIGPGWVVVVVVAGIEVVDVSSRGDVVLMPPSTAPLQAEVTTSTATTRIRLTSAMTRTLSAALPSGNSVPQCGTSEAP